jgi:signal transduction histidine kinase
VNAVRESQRCGTRVSRECRLTMHAGGLQALEGEVTSAPFTVDGDHFTLVSIRDISAEKRRDVLERVFFHDVLNTANGLQGLASLLVVDGVTRPDKTGEYHQLLLGLSKRLINEIRFHRQLIAAERHTLKVSREMVRIPALLEELAAFVRCHDAGIGREVIIGEKIDAVITTDPVLLHRVLVNLLINALEASSAPTAVTLSCGIDQGKVVFTVTNPGVISEEVRLQLFQRSFSTKGQQGRGLGTYSAKLFTESYLGGTIAVSSDAAHGTVVSVALPCQMAG